jgi:hypothetical protein
MREKTVGQAINWGWRQRRMVGYPSGGYSRNTVSSQMAYPHFVPRAVP